MESGESEYAGNEITLEGSSQSVGAAANPLRHFRQVIFGEDRTALFVSCGKEGAGDN